MIKINIGLSLLELMIVLAIISILSMMSVPLYSKHFAHAKRIEAEIQMLRLAAKLEQYFIENNSYENASLAKLNFPSEIAHGRYHLAIIAADSSQYNLQATPLAAQAKSDTGCGTLTLNSQGEKNNSGKNTLEECWG
jgi:type IV pilus assembly protein PilE